MKGKAQSSPSLIKGRRSEQQQRHRDSKQVSISGSVQLPWKGGDSGRSFILMHERWEHTRPLLGILLQSYSLGRRINEGLKTPRFKEYVLKCEFLDQVS